MRFDIAKSLNGERIVYIARDSNGIVRLRANTEEEIIEMIKNYNPIPSSKPTKSDDGRVHEEDAVKSEHETEQANSEPANLESIIADDTQKPETDAKEIAMQLAGKSEENSSKDEENKELLKNDLQEKVSEKKKKSGGTSFWDKLK